MYKTMSATQARIHFGELLRETVEGNQPILIEKNGKPQVVILSVEEYERLRQKETTPRSMLDQIKRSRSLVTRARKGSELPDAAEVIRQMRKERDEHFLDLFGR